MVSEHNLPDHLVHFLRERIQSIVELEVLFLLYSQPQRPWNARDIAESMRVDPSWVNSQLARLHAVNLIVHDQQAGESYCASTDSELTGILAELYRAYEQRRVTIVSLVYSKPADPIRNLADAFRIRGNKDPSDG